MITLFNFFIGLYVRATYCRRAIRDISKLKLGDSVSYDGNEWFTYQGVADPYWKITRLSEHGNRLVLSIHKDHLQMQPLWRRFSFSFMSTYRFFMSNWYQIDVKNKGRFIFKGL